MVRLLQVSYFLSNLKKEIHVYGVFEKVLSSDVHTGIVLACMSVFRTVFLGSLRWLPVYSAKP